MNKKQIIASWVVVIIILMIFGLKFTNYLDNDDKHHTQTYTSGLSLYEFNIGYSIVSSSLVMGKMETILKEQKGIEPYLLIVLATNKVQFIMAMILIGLVLVRTFKNRL